MLGSWEIAALRFDRRSAFFGQYNCWVSQNHLFLAAGLRSPGIGSEEITAWRTGDFAASSGK
jgi:hypothetical protein